MRPRIRRSRMIRSIRVLASIGTLAVVASVGAGASTAEAAKAPPPAKQVAALKQQIAVLKKQFASLRAENKRLRTQLGASSPAGIARQLTRTKAALGEFRSVDRAKAHGYVESSPCERSPEGGMGFHYVSGQAMADGKLDPVRPEILLYAPGPAGPELIGVEYFKPDADQDLQTDGDRPTLFGRAFDGPMLGHAPGMPMHYDLHVWFFKRNPSGVFAIWNPDVSCG